MRSAAGLRRRRRASRHHRRNRCATPVSSTGCPVASSPATGTWTTAAPTVQVAQMCGSGVRVFATICGPAVVSTGMDSWSPPWPGPDRFVVHHVDGYRADVTVEMGKVNLLARRRHRRRRSPDRPRRRRRQPAPGLPGARPVPRPTWLPSTVGAPVEFDREQFPDGVNVGSAHPCRRWLGVDAGTRTRCGRNTVLRHRDRGRHRRGPGAIGTPQSDPCVRVPGGQVNVEITESTSFLRGPSVLVATGELSEQWWADWAGRP